MWASSCSPNPSGPIVDSRSGYRRLHWSSVAAFVALVAGLHPNTARADDLNPHDLALLDRLTFGVSTASAAHMHGLGAERWLQEQLHPAGNPVLPDAAKAQIEAMPDVHSFPFDIAVAFEQQIQERQPGHRSRAEESRAAGLSAGDERSRQAGRGAHHPARALCARPVARAHDLVLVQSFQRASVQGEHPRPGRRLRGSRDPPHRARHVSATCSRRRCVIRRCCAISTMPTTPPAISTRTTPARSWSCTPWASAPAIRQTDVEELARILTGVGIDTRSRKTRSSSRNCSRQLVREGAFEFNPTRHDYGDKIFLGHTIKGRGLAEVDEALDILVPRSRRPRAHVSPQARDLFRLRTIRRPRWSQRMAQTFQTHRRRHRRRARRRCSIRPSSPPR